MTLSKTLSYTIRLCVLIIGLSSYDAKAACPDFPNVEWWAGFNHQAAIKYVERRYNGNWTTYIAVWQKQHSVLKDLYQRGKTAIIRGRTTVEANPTRYTRRIKNEKLADYIGKVAERIKVMECLSGQHGAATTTPDQSPPHQPIPNTIEINLETKTKGRKSAFKFGCLKCHGKESLAKYKHIPNLNGQNILYLARQLTEFQSQQPSESKSKRAQSRHSAFMRFQVNQFDDDEIWNISSYFASIPRCFKPPSKRTNLAAPEIIKNCSSCHGRQGITIFPEVPNLAGQNQEYILRQLRLFKSHDSKANTSNRLADSRYHFYVSRIAKDIEESELKVIANYYAALPCLQ